MKVGVAGCGRMGLGMARSIAHGGYDVTGFDVRPMAEFGDFSARMVAGPSDFAVDREVILTVVRDTRQTEDLLFDVQALLSHAKALKYLLVCSTLSPRYLADLRSRLPSWLAVVDAPMSGAQIAADESRLSFMLGGDDADLDALEPLLQTMGNKLHRMGGPGAGMTAKVLNNYVGISAAAAVRQALDWADDFGLDENKLRALMHDSSGQTWFGSNYDQIEFARQGYDTANTVGILKKDLESCLDAVADDARADMLKAAIAAIPKWTPRD